MSGDGSLKVILGTGKDGGYYSLGALDPDVTNVVVDANVLHANFNSISITVELYNQTEGAVVASASAAPPNGWYTSGATTFQDITFNYEPVAGDAGDTFLVRFWGSSSLTRQPALDFVRVYAYKPAALPFGTVISIQ